LLLAIVGTSSRRKSGLGRHLSNSDGGESQEEREVQNDIGDQKLDAQFDE
jgi:hypothetical protein